MSAIPESATPTQRGTSSPHHDDLLTICAISVLAAILSNVVHEGVGHGLTDLLTGAKSGLLTTVAWSSSTNSRLVQAGGTLANLGAALVFWIALRSANRSSLATRYFLLVATSFNLFTGTGYFFFSGVTNFGDWADVISGMHPHWLLRLMLVLVGIVSYYVSVVAVGIGLARYVGVPRSQQRRLRKLTIVPYISAVILASISALLNPLGIQLLWQSALPATAGGQSGLLWLQYYISRKIEPRQTAPALGRNYIWIVLAIVIGILYIFILGRGVTLHF